LRPKRQDSLEDRRQQVAFSTPGAERPIMFSHPRRKVWEAGSGARRGSHIGKTSKFAFRATTGCLWRIPSVCASARHARPARTFATPRAPCPATRCDKVTIEEICVEPEFRRRTFFNYFPNKSPRSPTVPRTSRATCRGFRRRRAAPYSVVLAELITLAAHHLRDKPRGAIRPPACWSSPRPPPGCWRHSSPIWNDSEST